MKARLQKILSEAGVASRREAETWIVSGRVAVNGRVVELGEQADPEVDHITVDGKPLRPASSEKVYLAFHKPRRVIVTRKDPEGRKTIYDGLPDLPPGVKPAGRLDYDSEGLLLLSNDGDFILKVTHPRYEILKTYRVEVFPDKVSGSRAAEIAAEKMRRGVELEDGPARPVSVRLLEKTSTRGFWLEIQLGEGRNREVRRLCEAVGLKVWQLKRIQIGPVNLGELKAGETRPLTAAELKFLLK